MQNCGKTQTTRFFFQKNPKFWQHQNSTDCAVTLDKIEK